MIWYHILFWLVHILFFMLLDGVNSGNYIQPLVFQLLSLPFKIMVVYFVLYYLLPKYLQYQKYFRFFLGLIFAFLIGMGIFHIIHHTFIAPILFNHPLDSPFLSITPSLLWQSLTTSYLLVLATLIKLTRIWQANEQRAQQALSDKLEAELKYLKAQIHPHFLFNTLNNLYTLALKKSDKAPQVIDKLSGLLRYMSYDANQAKVPLYKDIEHIENYVSLEKIRYGSRLEISFEVTGELQNKQIAPLILLPFVENSFKHGVSKGISNSWININIDMNKNNLLMKVENSVAQINHNQIGHAHGIGLKNVSRRLDLIYKDKFNLKIASEKHYLVHLSLDLS